MNTILRFQRDFWPTILGRHLLLAMLLMIYSSMAIAAGIKPVSEDVTYSEWRLIKQDGDWHIQDPLHKSSVFPVPFRARIHNCDGSSMLLKDYLLHSKATVIIRYDDKGVGVVREVFILCE